MRRRKFLALFSSAACGVPLEGRAQTRPKTYRVGLIARGAPVAKLDTSPALKAMLDGLRDLGYVEGQNLEVARRSAEGGGPERAGEIGAQLIRDGIDVIVVATTADAKAMQSVTSTVPHSASRRRRTRACANHDRTRPISPAKARYRQISRATCSAPSAAAVGSSGYPDGMNCG